LPGNSFSSSNRALTCLEPARCAAEQIIDRGFGDGYFTALTRAFAADGQIVYVRLMAEMNGSWNPYSAYGPGGYKGGAHSTRNFRQAWRRIVLIMRAARWTRSTPSCIGWVCRPSAV
jgi:hypothetical protein